MESYCFVCGLPLGSPEWTYLEGGKESLKWLLTRICKMFSICPEEDWDCLVNCEITQCCSNCLGLMRSIWESHQSLIQILETLNAYACEVQRSLEQSVGFVEDNIQLHPKCLQFRQQFANSRGDPLSTINSFITPIERLAIDDIRFLEPLDETTASAAVKMEPGTSLNDHVSQSLSSQEGPFLGPHILSQNTHEQPEVNSDPDTFHGDTHSRSELDLIEPVDDEDWQNDPSEDELWPNRQSAQRKRKFVVIAEEDEPLVSNKKPSFQNPIGSIRNTENKPVEVPGTKKVTRKTKYSYKYSSCGKLIVCHYDGCSYSSKWPKNVRRHEQSHLSLDQRTDVVSCPECDKKIHKDSLLSHLRSVHRRHTHTGEDIICPDCGKKFISKKTYNAHAESHREGKVFECDICSKRFASGHHLTAHIRNVHETCVIHCEHCDKDYNTKRRFRTHWVKHHHDKPYPAHLTTRFEQRVTVRAPKKRVHFCDHEGCTYSTIETGNLHRHKNTHLSFDQRTDVKICPHCGLEFTAGTINHHIRAAHPHVSNSEDGLVCPDCGKKFLSCHKSLFEIHMKQHRGETDFVCDECGKGFVTAWGLKSHRKGVHEEIDTKCEQCDKHFSKFSSYRHHWRKTHSGLTFPLLTAPRRVQARGGNREGSFYNQHEVERKAKLMMPKRMWPCDVCETICSTKQTLQKHQRRAKHQNKPCHLDDKDPNRSKNYTLATIKYESTT